MSRRARLHAGLVLAAAITIVAPSIGTDARPLPGPAPRSSLARIAGVGWPTNARCAECHHEIASEWRRSLHRRAWTDDYFQRAHALEPAAFCRNCHAPEADPAHAPDAVAANDGVGCVSCHVFGNEIVSSRSHHARGPRDHDVTADARFGTQAACAGCHEFRFPVSGELMQKTLSEHRQSAWANVACQSCHMPRKNGHRAHDFSVQSDVRLLRSAVVVQSAALDAEGVRLELATGKVGHAVPTGDLQRRLEVRAWREGGRRTRVGLERSFEGRRDGVREVADTRLSSSTPARVTVPLATKPGDRVRWQLVWQKFPPRTGKRIGLDPARHEVVLAEGNLAR